MSKQVQFFGIVKQKKYSVFAPQELEGKLVRLTTLTDPVTAAGGTPVSPAGSEIDLSAYEDKIIEVSGHESDGWIYSAQVVEEAGPVLSDFLRKVFCRENSRKKQCALIVGHRQYSPGMKNKNSDISEFEFNEKLASLIEKKVKKTDIQRVYRGEYAALPNDLNTMNLDFAVSLHCNHWDGFCSGTEVLYHHSFPKSEQTAQILLRHLVAYLGLPNRGATSLTVEDKGGFLLRYTIVPCVIAEPFFIDNDQDLDRALEDLEAFAAAFAKALDEISETIEGWETGLGIAV